jgi:hypothetical protein
MDLVSFLVATMTSAVFLLPAVFRPTLGRSLVGLFFIAGALFNLFLTLPNSPASLEALVATAFVPFYRDVMYAAIAWNATALLLLVIAFELAVGLLALWRGPLVKLALLGAGAWGIGMLPVIPPDGLLIGAALTAAPGIAALLLRRDYDEHVLTIARRRLRRERASPQVA